MNNYSLCNLQSISTVKGDAVNYTVADYGWSLHSTVNARLFSTYTTALPLCLVWGREKKVGNIDNQLDATVTVY